MRMNRREFLKAALVTAAVGPSLIHPVQAVGRRITYLILDDPIQDRPKTAMGEMVRRRDENHAFLVSQFDSDFVKAWYEIRKDAEL